MEIKDVQELVTTIGAGAGAIALCWNGWASWQSRSIKRSAKIQVITDRTGASEIVRVSFTGAETHTSYYLTVRCKRPRKLHARIYGGWETIMFGSGQAAMLPISIAMEQDEETAPVARAAFTPVGHSLKSALVLTFEVREQFASKVLARRKLAVTFG